jgi:hypothetical protein
VNPTDAEMVMLLAAHLLAMVMAVMVFLWMIALHRRTRAAEELTQHKTIVPTFESALISRPPLWMAVRSTDPGTVQSALGLNQPTRCSWTEGMTGARKFFVGPPVNGWIIVTGSGLPNPSCDVDECYRFIARISGQLGQVQLFHADRILHHHAWVRAENGVVTRAYAWAGETIWNQGAKTPAETELSMKCFGYGEEPNADSWAAVEWTAANVGKVPLLATRWSLDPARIDERARRHADGTAGESSRVY